MISTYPGPESNSDVRTGLGFVRRVGDGHKGLGGPKGEELIHGGVGMVRQRRTLLTRDEGRDPPVCQEGGYVGT